MPERLNGEHMGCLQTAPNFVIVPRTEADEKYENVSGSSMMARTRRRMGEEDKETKAGDP